MIFHEISKSLKTAEKTSRRSLRVRIKIRPGDIASDGVPGHQGVFDSSLARLTVPAGAVQPLRTSTRLS